jgi:hypothetical protein
MKGSSAAGSIYLVSPPQWITSEASNPSFKALRPLPVCAGINIQSAGTFKSFEEVFTFR